MGSQIKLFVDADGSPVLIESIRAGRSKRVPVVLVGNETQNLGRFAQGEDLELVVVPEGRDSADFEIVGRISPGDVIVTGDTGLAAMALGAGARAIDFRGREYDEDKIDAQLMVRHAENKLRRGGGRTKGPSAYEREDRRRFGAALRRVLDEQRKRV